MEENNKTNVNEEQTSTVDVQEASSEGVKSDKKKKDRKKGDKKSISSFLSQYKAEFRKITWPSRQELIKETITVIIISLLVGAIIFGMDYVFDFGFSKLANLI